MGYNVAIDGPAGAGKSTILRMVAGVLKPQQGEILVDGGQVYDRLEVKKKIYFISDDPYFFANCNPVDMQKYLCSVYPEFAVEDFYSYLMNFGLDKKRKVNTYSKGMRKQLALICGVCSGAKYLLCDELELFEKFANWHYDLDVNLPGVEVIHHLLQKMERLREENRKLINQLSNENI